MAERKSGPVRPPVIDLTAKAATRPSSDDRETVEPEAPAVAEADAAAAEPPEAPRPPRPVARLAMPWSAISIAAIGGAVLGTALTYGLVNVVALPDNRPVIADPSVRLAAQDAAIAELTTRLAAAEAASAATSTTVAEAASATAAELESLRQQLDALPAPAAAVDLAPLEAQVATLEASIAAIGAGASGADATALAETISGLEAGIGELRAALEALTQRTSTAEQSIASLRGDVEATRSAVAAQTSMVGASDIGPAVRLPLLVSGIESAFANGRPYDSELSSLSTLLPDLVVPDPIRTAAADGLPRPDAVALAFTEAVPAILAGRPAFASGDLTQDALDWAKGLLALRPLEEADGDTPEAVVSRLEAAVARRDFAAATALLGQLPEPMQAAAGNTANDISTLAAADDFIAALRTTALEAPAATEPADSSTPAESTEAPEDPSVEATP